MFLYVADALLVHWGRFSYTVLHVSQYCEDTIREIYNRINGQWYVVHESQMSNELATKERGKYFKKVIGRNRVDFWVTDLS
jgi:hypothetical protein